jgi:hypothetical protein
VVRLARRELTTSPLTGVVRTGDRATPLTSPFHFTGADGKDYSLPKMVKGGDLRKIRKLSNADQMFTLFEQLADEETLAALDDLSTAQVSDVYNDWMDGMSSGESSSSTV